MTYHPFSLSAITAMTRQMLHAGVNTVPDIESSMTLRQEFKFEALPGVTAHCQREIEVTRSPEILASGQLDKVNILSAHVMFDLEKHGAGEVFVYAPVEGRDLTPGTFPDPEQMTALRNRLLRDKGEWEDMLPGQAPMCPAIDTSHFIDQMLANLHAGHPALMPEQVLIHGGNYLYDGAGFYLAGEMVISFNALQSFLHDRGEAALRQALTDGILVAPIPDDVAINVISGRAESNGVLDCRVIFDFPSYISLLKLHHPGPAFSGPVGSICGHTLGHAALLAQVAEA